MPAVTAVEASPPITTPLYVDNVLFNPGEGLAETDLNDVQNYLHATRNLIDCAKLQSGENAGNYWSVPLDLFASYRHCFSPTSLHCMARARPTGLGITNTQGIIMQRVAMPDGHSPAVLHYFTAADELNTVFAPAHATLARWDLIAVKLDIVTADVQTRDYLDTSTTPYTPTTSTPYKKRRVRLQQTVVSGTPGTPTGTGYGGGWAGMLPAVPAGYVPWAMGYIQPGATSLVNDTHVFDMRVPSRRMSQWVPETAFWKSASSQWVQADASIGGAATVLQLVPAAVGAVAKAIFPGHPLSRVLGWAIYSAGGPTTQPVRHIITGGLDTLPNGFPALTSFVGTDYNGWGVAGEPSQDPNFLGPALSVITSPPLWGNGMGCPYATLFDNGQTATLNPYRYAVRVTTGGSGIGNAIFGAEFRWAY